MGKSIVRTRRRRRGRPSLLGVLAAHPPADPSPLALARLRMLEWHLAHGANVSRTARHFGWSRPTVYRWLARYEGRRLASLEDRSPAPHHRRRPTWTAEVLGAVQELRERYPRWGKDKLAVLLRRAGLRLSVSMVGRILASLRRRGLLREPVARRISVRRRLWRRPHAVRLPRDHPVVRPGDLVELDTLDVRLGGLDHPLKQFTARDRVSRWDVLELARSASAAHAVGALEAILARMPFPVRAISVDNGSEFMAGFEAACGDQGITLFVLPPRSPKLHGSVERSNRTHTEEFYEVTDAEAEFEALRPALRAWEDTYNHVRPHQALGQQTPAEFLAALGPQV